MIGFLVVGVFFVFVYGYKGLLVLFWWMDVCDVVKFCRCMFGGF